MKAPDIVEAWKWKSAEEIIERLLSISSRVIGTATRRAESRAPRDRYYTQARRLRIRRETKLAMLHRPTLQR